MAVNAFRLENFMAFRDTGWIETRPITLIFGKNSSGKSAIIRALRLLKQSLFSPTNKDEILTFETNELDCGSFDTIAYKDGSEDLDDEEKPITREISFNFRCDLTPEMFDIVRILSPSLNIDGFPFIELSIALRQIKVEQNGDKSKQGIPQNKVTLSRFILKLSSFSEKDSVILLRAKHYIDPFGKLWLRSEVVNASKWKNVSLRIPLTMLPVLIGDEPLEPGNKLITDLLILTNEEIGQFLDRFEYLGPMRPEPRRIFALDNLERQRWEKQGLKTWITYLKTGRSLDARITNALIKMELCKDADVNPSGYKGTGVVSEINVTDSITGLPYNLRDVGYGMSQVLPVIATCYKAPANSMVIIEQPELHLHPQAQTTLTNVFIEAVNQLIPDPDDKTAWTSENKKFLIETHSEHILLRIRRCIAETAAGGINLVENANQYLLPENVRVYFVDEGKVHEIQFDNYGDIVEVPKGFIGFFSDNVSDISIIAQSQYIAKQLKRVA
jgi:hypothetical protein